MKDQNGEKPPIPDFMKKYHDALDFDGKFQIERAAQQYEAERQEFMNNRFVQQSNFQADYNRVTGRNTKLDPEEATRPIREKYEQLANEKAVEYGYVEKDAQKATEQAQPALGRREQFLQQAAAIRQRNGQRQVTTEAKGGNQEHNKVNQKPQSEGQATNQEAPAAPQAQSDAQPQTRREIFLATAAEIRTRRPTEGIKPS